MATTTQGILGGFSGRLGPVVGYQWNGKWCMRSRPQYVRNPRTEAQQAQRGLFSEEVRLAASMRWAVAHALTVPARAAGMTAYNLFVSINQPAFSLDGASPDGGKRLVVDYANLQLSLGPVAPVAVTGARVDEGLRLEVDFERNPMHLSSSQFDSVYLYVYAPSLEQGYLTAPVYRRERHLGVVLPETMAGAEVHIYAYVVDSQGRASSTAYGGCLTVAAGEGFTVDTTTGEQLPLQPPVGTAETAEMTAERSLCTSAPMKRPPEG